MLEEVIQTKEGEAEPLLAAHDAAKVGLLVFSVYILYIYCTVVCTL